MTALPIHRRGQEVSERSGGFRRQRSQRRDSALYKVSAFPYQKM